MITKKIIALIVFCVLLFSNHTTHCMKSLVEVIASEPYWRCVKYGDPDPRDKDFEMVKKLLEDGADVDELGVEGYYENKTPLIAAIFNEHGKTAELLLNHGADINKKGYNYHNTPLHISLRSCPNINLFVMTLLLERNAQICFSHSDKKQTDIKKLKKYRELKCDFLALFTILEKLESSQFKNKSETDFNEFCLILKTCLELNKGEMCSGGGELFDKETEISKEYIYIRVLVARILFALTSKKEFKLFKKCLNQQLDTEFLTTNVPDYPFLYERDQKIHKQVSIHLLKHFLDYKIIKWDDDILSVLPSKKLRKDLYYMPTRMYEPAISMNLNPDINFNF